MQREPERTLSDLKAAKDAERRRLLLREMVTLLAEGRRILQGPKCVSPTSARLAPKLVHAGPFYGCSYGNVRPQEGSSKSCGCTFGGFAHKFRDGGQELGMVRGLLEIGLGPGGKSPCLDGVHVRAGHHDNGNRLQL